MRKAAPALAAIVLLVLPLYFGAYRLALDPHAWNTVGAASWPLPQYRFGGEAAKVFFWPAYQVDRWIRPRHWEWTYDYWE